MSTADIEWLNTNETAKRLGITPRTLYRFIDDGKIPAYRFGRVIRLKESEVAEFIEQSRIVPGTLDTGVARRRGPHDDRAERRTEGRLAAQRRQRVSSADSRERCVIRAADQRIVAVRAGWRSSSTSDDPPARTSPCRRCRSDQQRGDPLPGVDQVAQQLRERDVVGRSAGSPSELPGRTRPQ